MTNSGAIARLAKMLEHIQYAASQSTKSKTARRQGYNGMMANLLERYGCQDIDPSILVEPKVRIEVYGQRVEKDDVVCNGCKVVVINYIEASEDNVDLREEYNLDESEEVEVDEHGNKFIKTIFE